MLEQDDIVKFVEAILGELYDNNSRNHLIIVDINQMSNNIKTIMFIWSFKRKRLQYGIIVKNKARLCTYGRQQLYVVNYWATYSPAINWISARLLLTICHLHKLE